MYIGFRSAVSILMKSVLLVSLFLWMFIGGCSLQPERDNPLDPNSDHYQPGGVLQGRVTMLNGSTPIAGVAITLSPKGITVHSDSAGYYRFSALKEGDYTLSLTHQGYASSTNSLNLGPAESKTRNFSLNALPVFDSVSVSSQRLQLTAAPNERIYRLKIYAEITDPDGEGDLTDSANVQWLQNQTAKLARQAGVSYYSVILDSTRFPAYKIENMLGVQMTALVSDKHNATVLSQLFQLVRVINSFVGAISPSGTTSSIPTFSWNSAKQPTLEFDEHFYRLQVYDDLNPEQVIYEAVVTDTLHQMAGDSLEPGSYSWRVQVEDFFGDFSRSQRVYFTVQ